MFVGPVLQQAFPWSDVGLQLFSSTLKLFLRLTQLPLQPPKRWEVVPKRSHLILDLAEELVEHPTIAAPRTLPVSFLGEWRELEGAAHECRPAVCDPRCHFVGEGTVCGRH